MPAHVLVIGRLAMDFNIDLPNFPIQGTVVTASSFRPEPGGKGLNQAVAAARLGTNAYVMAKLGGDKYADEIIEMLDRYGVNRDFVDIDDRVSTGIVTTLVDNSSSIPTFILTNPQTGRLTPDFIEARQGMLGQMNAVIITPAVSVPATIKALTLAKDNNSSVITLFNYAPAVPLADDDVNALVKVCDYLFGTNNDIRNLAGSAADEPEEKVIDKLLKRGFRAVCITDGVDGGIYGDKSTKLHFKSFPAQDREDLTGASDAFCTAFTISLLEGNELRAALRYGIAAGAFSTKTAGGAVSMPYRNQLEQYLNNPNRANFEVFS